MNRGRIAWLVGLGALAVAVTVVLSFSRTGRLHDLGVLVLVAAAALAGGCVIANIGHRNRRDGLRADNPGALVLIARRSTELRWAILRTDLIPGENVLSTVLTPFLGLVAGGDGIRVTTGWLTRYPAFELAWADIVSIDVAVAQVSRFTTAPAVALTIDTPQGEVVLPFAIARDTASGLRYRSFEEIDAVIAELLQMRELATRERG